MSTVEDNISTAGDTMMSVGDIMSTPGDVQHWGFITNSVVFPMTFPHIYHDSPPLYS